MNIQEYELLTIKVQININIIMGVAYISPNAQFTFNSLDNIFQGNTPMIIGRDFNAKHRAWNKLLQ